MLVIHGLMTAQLTLLDYLNIWLLTHIAAQKTSSFIIVTACLKQYNATVSNLIITIISIALAAVTTLAGVYYGGLAWSNYHHQLVATDLQFQILQLKNAARHYMNDKGQDLVKNMSGYPSPFNNNNNVSLGPLLISNYLNQNFPHIPVIDDFGYFSNSWSVEGDLLSISALPANPPYFLTRMYYNGTGINAAQMKTVTDTCKAIVKIVHGDASKFAQRADGTYSIQPMSQIPGINPDFDCFIQYVDTPKTDLDQCADPAVGCRVFFIGRFY